MLNEKEAKRISVAASTSLNLCIYACATAKKVKMTDYFATATKFFGWSAVNF